MSVVSSYFCYKSVRFLYLFWSVRVDVNGRWGWGVYVLFSFFFILVLSGNRLLESVILGVSSFFFFMRMVF